jgi:phosphoglycerate dehydrogenase-like enzyme
MTDQRINVLIATYLEPEHVERIRAVDERLHVLYEPELLGAPRYPADHYNLPQRTPAQEARWRELLAVAEVLFDFDPTHREDLPDLALRLRWVQATSAGIGQFVKRYRYDERLPQTVFTTASGIHARPLAEFCILAMLMFNKGLLRMLQNQQRHHWERYAGTDLAERTLGIVGMGSIGEHVARLGRAFGMTVIGTAYRTSSDLLDQAYPMERLPELLRRSDYLVLAVPHTPQTEGMIGAQELAQLPSGAILINVARGAVVDEQALVEALRSGHLRGAALDVFAEEPLPADSPLWSMDNVLVSPHSASTSDRENAQLTDLFCENLRRYLAGRPLLNVLHVDRLY